MSEQKPSPDNGPAKPEGPRHLSHLLTSLDDGVPHLEASKKCQELVAELSDHARMRDKRITGTLTIALTIAVDAKGVAEVSFDSKTKAPPRKRSPSTVWVTKGGNLTTEIPRQEPLFTKLSAVPGGAQETSTPRTAAKDA